MNVKQLLPIGLALTLINSVHAELFEDFSSTNLLGLATQLNIAPGPLISTTPPAANTNSISDGSFLRLINDGVGNNHNHYTYDLTDTGAFERIEAFWDFRGASIDNGADGFHFMLVPTADYGESGDGPAPTAEEPNIVNTFGVGFDFHPAGSVNDVSLHWDALEYINRRPINADLDIDNREFHRAHLNIDRVGNSSRVRLEVTPNILTTNPAPSLLIYDTIVPFMLPYENRVQFGGRTGGSNMDVDIDNVQVNWTNELVSPPTVALPDRLYQDFDALGTTDFFPQTFSVSRPDIPRPGPVPMDDGDARAAYLRLLHDNVNSGRNAISFDHVPTPLTSSQGYAMDFRMQAASLAADGIGISFLPTSTFGLQGPGDTALSSEAPNRAGVLAIGIGLHPEDTPVNDVSVHFDGQELFRQTLDPVTLFDFRTGVWSRLEILTDATPLGTEITVNILPDIDGTNSLPAITAVDRFVVTNLPALYEHRLMIGGRSGGRYVDVDLDNITGTTGNTNVLTQTTVQTFDVAGTRYDAWAQPGATPTPTPALVNEGGPNGNFLRLAKDGITNHRNALILEQTPDAVDVSTNDLTVASMDVRFRSADANNPADGLSMMLIPVDTYGTRGPGAQYNNARAEAELPAYPGVLGIGLDIHNEAQGFNDLVLYWDGALVERVNMPDSTIDLDDGFFHHLGCTIQWTSTGAFVNVSLASNVFASATFPTNLISQFIPSLMPYDYRVEVAARTGGAHADHDVDNVTAATGSVLENDLDQDGIEDAWEIAFFGNLTTTDGRSYQDFDLDGFIDWAEYQAETDPTDGASLLLLRGAAVPGGQQIRWDSSGDLVYRLFRKNSLHAPWMEIEPLLQATPPVNTYTDPVNLESNLYYRIDLAP